MPSAKVARKKKRKSTNTPGRGRRPEPSSSDRALREHLVMLLRGKGAHVAFDDAVNGCQAEVRGVKPPGAGHSAWEIVEHMRIAQWDILGFSRKPGHVSPDWPNGYWPEAAAPPDDEAWENSLRAFRADLKAMEQLVTDPRRDLFAPFPWGQGQTLLREALLVADHNAYHLGELVLLRRLLGDWTG
jgi:hypothetical protein